MSKQYRNKDNPGLKKRILSVVVKSAADDSPDASHIGQYAREPGEPDKTIDREERGDCGRNELRYFIAAMSAKETGSPKSVEEDYKRMEAMNRGEWYMMGIWAEADVQFGTPVMQTIKSGGLWGVESDSDKEYLEEIAQEQLQELSDTLVAMGFKPKQVREALKEVKRDS